MAAAAILNFENALPFFYYWTNPHQIWWERWESDTERNRQIKNVNLPKFKMAVAAVLKFENMLPVLYYYPNPHQIRWECWEFYIERNWHMKNAYFLKFKMATAAILNFGKCVAISLLLDQASPNLMGMLRIWQRTQLSYWKCIFIRFQDGVHRHFEF